MPALAMTKSLVRAAAFDAGNRSMRRVGRKAWNEDDLHAAVAEFNRLWPEERELAELRRQQEVACAA